MDNFQIFLDEIQPVEKLSFIPLEKIYVKVLTARITLVYFLLMACALIPWLIDSCDKWMFCVIECVLATAFAINLGLLRRIYDIKGYALRSKDISYRKGLFFTSVTTVPFNKIQQISIRVNPISRIFGLCYLDIINGSQATANQITIPGLTREKAERLKSFLIRKADCEDE